MSKKQIIGMIIAGLLVSALGLALLLIGGGWSTTGIGTTHSGTTGGLFSAMLTFGGLIFVMLALVGQVTMAINQRNARR